MSRSRKKIKIRGISTADSEKQNKRRANRKLRRIISQKIKTGEDKFPELKEVSNVWCFDKDGKIFDKTISEIELRK
ncbi:hypothetical protein [Flexithrix dorotheae]|uniref:hypothetical protein n=1 Tax=Flexithrix dorotheae TaxID=70993 RepID=UPI000376000C|nr:hypothetical protein [Flexithrix dorotheae]